MSEKNGGHAFPSASGVFGGIYAGASLRDYFAAHAPWPPQTDHLRKLDHQIMLNDKSHTYRKRSELDLIAEWRFDYAQAMVNESQKRGREDEKVAPRAACSSYSSSCLLPPMRLYAFLSPIGTSNLYYGIKEKPQCPIS